MRNLFRGYYTPNDEEFNGLWKNCIFSFDTNILLNIYRYTPKSRERFFEILNKLEDRIWITHQVAYEYHRNRLDVISNQSKPYKEIHEYLDKSFEDLKNLIEQYNKRHSFSAFIDIQQLLGTVSRAHNRAKKVLNDSSLKYCEQVDPKELHEQLTNLFDGKVGDPYSKEDLSKSYKLAEERGKNNIPPGYLDFRGSKKKQPPDCYGDIILWFQLINYAKANQHPVIFVTDEDGEDWWLQHKGKTLGPRPELRQEMLSEAGVDFYLYTGDRFLDFASDFLDLADEPEVIEEARDVRSQEHEDEAAVALSNQLDAVSRIKNINQWVEQWVEQFQAASKPVDGRISALTEQISASSALSRINQFAEQLRAATQPLDGVNSFAEQFLAENTLSQINQLVEQLRATPRPLDEVNSFAEQFRISNRIVPNSYRSSKQIPQGDISEEE